MNEEQLVKQLNKLKPKPSQEWQLSVMKNFDNFVTEEPKIRNSFFSIFYFLNLSNMSIKLKAIISIISVVAIFGAGTGTIYASDSANPGDFLFGLDKAVEGVQRVFTTDPVKEADLELAIMDERVSELEELSVGENTKSITTAISEIEEQQLRLQERFQEMDQLRIENKLQTQEQLQVMEKLQTKTQVHEEIMDQVQTNLKSNGDNSNSDSLLKVQSKYSDETETEIRNFEQGSGVQIQETEDEQNQNQNDGTQENQEQEQEKNQNQNTDSGSLGNPSENAQQQVGKD